MLGQIGGAAAGGGCEEEGALEREQEGAAHTWVVQQVPSTTWHALHSNRPNPPDPSSCCRPAPPATPHPPPPLHAPGAERPPL